MRKVLLGGAAVFMLALVAGCTSSSSLSLPSSLVCAQGTDNSLAWVGKTFTYKRNAELGPGRTLFFESDLAPNGYHVGKYTTVDRAWWGVWSVCGNVITFLMNNSKGDYVTLDPDYQTMTVAVHFVRFKNGEPSDPISEQIVK